MELAGHLMPLLRAAAAAKKSKIFDDLAMNVAGPGLENPGARGKFPASTRRTA